MSRPAVRDRRHRPDASQEARATTCRSPGSSARPRCARSTTREMTWSRHRRGRPRQGARPVRRRHEARAVPRRRARRGRQADVPRAHRGLASAAPPASSASHLVESRRPRARARGRVEKQSRGQRAVRASAGGRGASHRRGRRVRAVHPLVHRTAAGAPEYIGWQVAVKDRLNALKNPYAHLQARRHLASRR